MAIAFRCTRCRARLHVPTRWHGTSVACPKCATRVVVPEAGAEGSTGSPFEHPDVERSLASLEGGAGGIFSDAAFELPTELPDEAAAVGSGPEDPAPRPPPGLTVPRWAVYASMVGYAAAIGLGFSLGWLTATGRWWR